MPTFFSNLYTSLIIFQLIVTRQWSYFNVASTIEMIKLLLIIQLWMLQLLLIISMDYVYCR